MALVATLVARLNTLSMESRNPFIVLCGLHGWSLVPHLYRCGPPTSWLVVAVLS